MHANDAPTETVWDVVVVGAGLGGSVLARQLADAGVAVLLIESGRRVPPPPVTRGFLDKVKRRLGLDKQAALAGERWPDPLWVGQGRHAERPGFIPYEMPMGWGLGGGSALYGAALGRFRRHDIEQDDSAKAATWADHPAHLGPALPTHWPLAFDTLKGYYRRAEALMGICGSPEPLDPEDDAELTPPPPLSPREAAICADLTHNGLHPYRLHVGIEYRPGCVECQGIRCPRGCKADGLSRALAEPLAARRLTLESDLYVRAVERDETRFRVVTETSSGASRVFHARRVVLAAGALNTPLILQRSPGLWADGKVPELVGRGLMFHVSELFAVFDRQRASNIGPRKALGLRDFYRVNDIPYGEIQSLGFTADTGLINAYLKGEAKKLGLARLGPLLELLRIPAAIAARLFCPTAIFATIVEDIPYRNNRVMAMPDPVAPGRYPPIAIHYMAAPELRRRCLDLRRLLKGAFAPNRLFWLSKPATPNWGHPMGTCRMGEHPEVSVVDAECRLWGVEGLSIADASVFPSSAGANPGLTIVANALRVGDRLIAERQDPRPA